MYRKNSIYQVWWVNSVSWEVWEHKSLGKDKTRVKALGLSSHLTPGSNQAPSVPHPRGKTFWEQKLLTHLQATQVVSVVLFYFLFFPRKVKTPRCFTEIHQFSCVKYKLNDYVAKLFLKGLWFPLIKINTKELHTRWWPLQKGRIPSAPVLGCHPPVSASEMAVYRRVYMHDGICSHCVQLVAWSTGT